MKKALVIFIALAMTFAAFADAPAAVCDITTFTGNASVTWGVDLESGKTGFKNDTQVTFVFDIFSKGIKNSEGEGVWGDIGMGIRSWEDNAYYRLWYTSAGQSPSLNMPAIQLDHAIIHINDFYIGIAAGDTKVGNLEILQAVSSDNGNYKINDVGADKDQGITLGYANDLFGVDVDVRSKADAAGADTYTFAPISCADEAAYVPAKDEVVYIPTYGEKTGDGTSTVAKLFGDEAAYFASVGYGLYKKTTTKGAAGTVYTDNYAFAGQVDIKAVAGLTLNGGMSYDASISKNNVGAFGKVVYEYALDDTFYVKPQVGFSKDPADKKLMSAGLFFGWNKNENQDTNIYFIDKDVSNGFSVATQKDLDEDALPLTIGIWDSASLVPNLTFGAEFLTADITASTLDAKVVGEAKYNMNGIVPKLGISTNLADNSPLALKAGVEFNGFIANTSFSADYATTDLGDDKGTFSVTAKVSF